MRKRVLGIVTAVLLFMPAAYARPVQTEGAVKDVFRSFDSLHWKMNRRALGRTFSVPMAEQGNRSYSLGMLNGRKGVMYFEFGRKENAVVQTSMGVPVGDLSDAGAMEFFNGVEKMMTKRYGKPADRLRGAAAQKMYDGVVAYDYWSRRGTDIVLLLDMNAERLREMIGKLGKDIPPEAAFLKENGDKVVALIFRREGWVTRDKPGRKKEQEKR